MRSRVSRIRIGRAAAVATAILIGAGLAGAGGYDKAEFEELMEGAARDTRVLVGALVADDFAKAQSSAEAIAGSAKKMRGLTPKVGADRIEAFQAHADSLAARAGRLASLTKAKEGPRASLVLGEVVATCTGCHATYRK